MKSLNLRELSPPDKYASVRSKGFEQDIEDAKLRAIGRGARGAGTMAKGAAKASMLFVPSAAEDVSRGAEEIKHAIREYRVPAAEQAAADRELEAQIKRETRDKGMKKGGMTASKRADGIAQRGKTRGKVY